MPPARPRPSKGLPHLAAPQRRQLILFVLAICAPVALLVALGARTLGQERQLAQQHIAERRRALAGAVEHSLLQLLRELKAEEFRERGDRLNTRATVFVAPLRPSSQGTVAARGTELFRRQIDEAERLELVQNEPAAAAAAYQAILQGARDASSRAHALMLLARAQHAAGDSRSRDSYLGLLQVPFSVRDEHGIPYMAYGARALRGDTTATNQLATLTTTVLASRSLSAAGCFAIADAISTPAIRERCAEIETGELLQRDRNLMNTLRSDSTESRWTSYADGRWLVGRGGDSLVAFRVDSVLAALAPRVPADVTVLTASIANVERLPGFPELGAVWAGEVTELRRAARSAAFYGFAIMVVLATGLLGAWFLWRDVRRETEVARLRGQFVASVSHELRTPLTSIRMFAETLRDRESIDPRTRAQYLDTVARETERLTRLLDNVLDFSRIERGERTYRMAPISLPAIVERALSALRFPLEQQGFVVTLSSSEYMPLVTGDADALEQAVLNLLSNAIKYSGSSRSIDVILTHRNGTVAIAVRDSGLGIAPSHQVHLFERFYRAPVSENESIPGTGLGLTLVEHIASAHGGRVALESAPGVGSTFTMQLPATA